MFINLKKTMSALLIGGAASMCFNASAAVPRTDYETIDKEVEELLSLMTLDEKLEYIGGVDNMYIRSIDRLSLPRVRMSDGPQGVGTGVRSTAYPSTVLLTANWDEDMARRYGEALANDCRAHGVNIILAPAVNIYRAPFCGRNFEYMGEDPYLAARTASNYIQGVQSKGVMATVKHFLGNNSDYDRHNISNDIDERALNEIYLPAFKAAVQEANVGAVMTSYNLTDGIYTSEDPHLLKDILRDQWGFRGVVMSDWGAVHHAVPTARSGLDLEMPGASHMNVKDMKYYIGTGDVTEDMIDEKVRNILRAVLIFGFNKPEGPDGTNPDNPESAQVALDAARGGIVLLKNEKNILPLKPSKYRKILVAGRNATGYVYGGGSGQVAPYHYVSLLDGIKAEGEANGATVEYLDLNAFAPEILFTDAAGTTQGLKGEYFSNMEMQGKPAFTRTDTRMSNNWNNESAAPGFPREKFSVRWTGYVRPTETGDYRISMGGDDGFRVFFQGDKVIENWKDGAIRTENVVRHLEAGKSYPIVIEYYQNGGGAGMAFDCGQLGKMDPRLIKTLNDADLVVACVGYTGDSEGEDSDRSFQLLDPDLQLIEALKATRTPAVTVINSGGGVDMDAWLPRMNAVLWAGYAGQEAGTAVADILYGKVNPSGKLPMTFEHRWEDNPVYNSYHDTDGDKHVKYTEGVFTGYRGYQKNGVKPLFPFGYGLSYTNFRLAPVSAPRILPDGSVEVECRLTNTGKRRGAQVVQAYIGQDDATIERPANELKGFQKVTLDPGKSQVLKFTFPREAFSTYSVEKSGFVVPSGQYHIALGFSSADLPVKTTLKL